MEEILYQKMSSDPYIINKVGNRIYYQVDDWEEQWEDKLPMITYSLIAEKKTRVSKILSYYQLTTWATTFKEAKEISDKLSEIFHHIKNDWYNYSVANDQVPLYDRTDCVHWVALDVSIIYRK